VLHTRVSEQLSEDIRELAEELRVPVSNLVRNVLEEVFSVVENVSDDVGDFFDDVVAEADAVRERIRTQRRPRRTRGRRARPRSTWDDELTDIEEEFRQDAAAEARAHEPTGPTPVDEVLGWQPFVLGRAVGCARCGRAMSAGESAFVGVRMNGGSGPVVCPPCTRNG